MIYGVVSTLVNLCNAYDKQEIIPEMIELAKFAKRHIPEEHELDDPDFVTKRVTVMILGQHFTSIILSMIAIRPLVTLVIVTLVSFTFTIRLSDSDCLL